jgi:RNA polymerase sigma-70 factor (ECF subfamily)
VGLTFVEGLMRLPELEHYIPVHAAWADLCRRADRYDEARDAYRRALELSEQEPTKRYFQWQLDRLPAS